MRHEITISGMHCASCAVNIEKKLRQLPGVVEASVNFATGKATIEGKEGKEGQEEIRRTIEGLGYKIVSSPANDSLRELKYLTIFSGFSSLLIFFLSGREWPVFLLATVVQFYAGRVFYQGALRDLRVLRGSMDSLVALATSVAYFYSLGVLLKMFSGQIFFETSAFLIFFILLGKYLEARTLRQTNEAVRRLTEVGAKEATVLINHQEKKVPVAELKVGDLIVVKPGEKVPVDGEIIEGESTVDESLVTGESLPVEKKAGGKVIGGSLNKFGTFIFKAQKVGKETLLSQIIAFVEKAQLAKAPIQRLADRISAVFVPAILVISFLVFGIWYLALGASLSLALSYAVATLVIACPCALGLATPTAIIVGTGLAAQKGILIKGGEALEKVDKIKTVIFDKTGTLTKGEPEIVALLTTKFLVFNFKFLNKFKLSNDQKLLLLAASVEQKSEHPLGQAIVKKAKEEKLALSKVEGFKALPGMGVVGDLGDMRVKITKTQSEEDFVQKWRGKGATVVEVQANQKILGFIALADQIKPMAREAVTQLKKKNYQTFMITGDDKKTAQYIAQELGIEKVIAGVMPEEKAKHLVPQSAFVGDGINDAPALSAADLGIAMGGGTEVAREAGDIVLVKSDPLDVVRAIDISRATFRKVKFNFFWAFIYNLLGVPIAAGALSSFGLVLRPEFAGLAMAFSSVSVVINSLLLKRTKIT